MTDQQAQPRIVVGDSALALPPGVPLADWALERRRFQNPRIRTLLGAIRLLEQVLDSNYAILHCSPARVREIWKQVRATAEVIEQRFAPLLRHPSPVPRLDEARRGVGVALRLLETSTIDELARHPAEVPDDQLERTRRLLCVSMGKLHAFLQDSFGAVMGADPRSLHDQDYFLSRRFRRDVEEAEWLLESVEALERVVQAAARDNVARLEPWIERLASEHLLPDGRTWQGIAAMLERVDELAGKVDKALALQGIRFEELELLQGYRHQLPLERHAIAALYAGGREAVDELMAAAPGERPLREQAIADLAGCHRALSRHLLVRSRTLHDILRDLAAFVPIWLANIRKRRALLLYSGGSDGPADAAGGG